MSEYEYSHSKADHTKSYLWPVVDRALAEVEVECPKILDLGCGNGAFAGNLANRNYSVVGIDVSESGIQQARMGFPKCNFHVMSAYDPIKKHLGSFDVILSLEVVEHLYDPRKFAANIFEALTPGGVAIVSTPFHGYWKNLLLALTGKLDSHFTALWDHGHIKFWSVKTLRFLLDEAGLRNIRFHFAGRIPVLAKSMVAIAHKPRD